MTLFPVTRKRGGDLSKSRDYPLESFRDELDSLFQRFFGGWMSPFEGDFGSMRVWDFDVQENDNEILIRAELPGFEEKDLDVQFNDNLLTIKAEKKAEKKEEGRQEQSYRSFRRTVTLPPGIDSSKIQANYRNGVLELHVPRPPASKAKRITVKSD